MKQILEKCLSVILAITILFSSALVGLNELDFAGILSVDAYAASVDDLSFALNIDGKSYTVASCNSGASGKIVVPDTYMGLPVTAIGSNAFNGCKKITSVTLPDSVTVIGDYSFNKCKSLATIKLPNTLTSIGEFAFYDCSYYNNESNWENGVLYIGKYLISANTYDGKYTGNVKGDYVIKPGTLLIAESAFKSCKELTSVTIPDSIKKICDYAFGKCGNMKAVYITDLVAWCNIEFEYYYSNPLYYAERFYVNGERVKDLVIPDGITEINYATFYHFDELASVTIPDSVKSIGNDSFHSCPSLTSIKIPTSVKSIGNNSFKGCTGLTSVTVPGSVKTIGSEAFADCLGLTSINLSDSLTYIGKDAFFNTGYYKNKDNWIKRVLYIDNHIVNAKPTINGKRTVKYGTKSIASHAFAGCTGLTSIKIPGGVTSIGDNAFYRCTGLKSIVLRDSLKTIGERAFLDCTKLKSIDIPDKVKSIGYQVFKGCKNLATVEIGSAVTTIGEEAFNGCSNLTEIVIPGRVKTIEDSAFYNCRKLASVKLGSNVESIGKYAFLSCNISYILIPKSVTKIKTDAFGYYYDKNGNYKRTPNFTISGYKGTVAEKYAKSNDFKFYKYIKDCKHSKTKWYTVSKPTIYDPGLKHKQCLKCGRFIKTTEIPQLKCSKAKLKTISITTSGVKITWGKVEGADTYKVYRRTEKGDWRYLGYTKTTSYVDKNPKSGVKYRYAVKVKNEGGDSGLSKSLSKYYLAAPKLSTLKSVSGGVKIAWGKVSGAGSYKVYRKTRKGDWKYIGTTQKISYTDKKMKNGVKYIYAVKTISQKGNSVLSKSLSIIRLSTPKLKPLQITRSGVEIDWGKVKGADSYKVYRRTQKGDWRCIGTTKKSSYIDENPKSGVKYIYAVRAVCDGGESTLSKTLTKYYLAAPELSTPQSTKSGVKLKWSKSAGVEGYMVYRKTGSGSYSKIATVKGSTKVTYTDKAAKKGKKYTYKVKAYKSKTYSAYSNTKSVTDKY